MLSEADRAQMRAAHDELRGDNAVSVAIRRGSTTLAAQTVRIARRGRGAATGDSADSNEAEMQVVIIGAPGLDIKSGDRLNDSAGNLYRVVFVRPRRDVGTQAEAVLVD